MSCRIRAISSLGPACARGDMAEVRRLVEEEYADVDKGTSSGPTPLCSAALHSEASASLHYHFTKPSTTGEVSSSALAG